MQDGSARGEGKRSGRGEGEGEEEEIKCSLEMLFSSIIGEYTALRLHIMIPLNTELI